MSITVRLWSDEELQKIKNGEDKFLATVFMNVKTFGEKEIKFYPYHLRKVYEVNLQGTDLFEVYATDRKNAIEFIKREYNTKEFPIVDLMEVSYHSPQEIADLKDKLHRRNMQIKELKKKLEVLPDLFNAATHAEALIANEELYGMALDDLRMAIAKVKINR